MGLGKWLLGGFGFVMGGPIGALLGVVIGSLFENTHVSVNTSTSRGRAHATQADIHVSIIVLIACVIKADGRILKSEINFIKPFLVRTFGEQGAKQALLLLKQLLQKDMVTTLLGVRLNQRQNTIGKLINGAKEVTILKPSIAPNHIMAQ